MQMQAEFELQALYKPTRGNSAYTALFCRDNGGSLPVYSASLRKPLGHMNRYDYEGDYLSVTLNGYAGYTQRLKGRFSVNADRAVLVPLEAAEGIDLDFLANSIEPSLRSLAIGRIVDGRLNEFTKISPDVISTISVRVPVLENGSIDVDRTLAIGERIRYRKALQADLNARLQAMEECEFLIDQMGPSKRINLTDGDFFRLSIGKRILKRDLIESGVPVFSANVQTPFGHLASYPSHMNFSKPSLLWAIDGVFDWNLFDSNEPFVPTDHIGRAEILNDQLYPRYVLWELLLSKSDHGFDRVYRASLDHMSDVSVRIPLTNEGAPDLAAQQELAARYDKLHLSRENCLAALRDVVVVSVESE